MIIYNLYQKIEADEILPNFWGQHLPNTKTRQRHYKKVNHRPISLMDTDGKILNKILASWIKQSNQVRFTPVMRGWCNGWKPMNVIHHINRMKKKNHVIVAVDTEKAFDKIQQSFIVKTFIKLGIEGNVLSLKKSIHKNSIANIIRNGKRSFCAKICNKARISYHSFSVSCWSPINATGKGNKQQ